MKHYIHTLVVGIATCLLYGCSTPRATIGKHEVFKADAVIQKAELLSVGVYIPDGSQVWADTNAVSGQIRVHNGVSFSHVTTNVPGVVGAKFGFEYILSGEPTNATVEVTVIRKYPAPGLHSPKAKSPVLESKRRWKVTLGERTGIGYGFDHEWEIVSGVWSFQIWSKEKKLLEQAFLVRKPKEKNAQVSSITSSTNTAPTIPAK